MLCFFFFQAEDGIRDLIVTGVQTCALPIFPKLSIGDDKITLIASSPIESFGIWAEQLLAESTGKQGKGLIPVAGEPLAEPAVYGADRLFVALLLPGEDPGTERALRDLEAAGQPVVVLRIDEPLDLGAEFYRWEVAHPGAGSALGINPIDVPNMN